MRLALPTALSILLSIVVSTLSLAPAVAVRADTVRVDFLGTVSLVYGGAVGQFSVGDPVSGSVEYYQGSHKVAGYLTDPAPINSMSAQIGSYSVVGDPTNSSPTALESFVYIADSTSDSLSFRTRAIGDPVAGYAPTSLQFGTGPMLADALSTDAYPPDAAGFETLQPYLPFTSSYLTFGPISANTRVDFRFDSFTVTDLTPVPEPTTALLLGLGVAAATELGGSRRTPRSHRAR